MRFAMPNAVDPWLHLHISQPVICNGETLIYHTLSLHQSMSVADRSKARDCGRSLAGIAGSNPAGGMDFYLLCVLFVVRYRSLRRTNPSSSGVRLWCVIVCDLESSMTRRTWPALGCCDQANYIKDIFAFIQCGPLFIYFFLSSSFFLYSYTFPLLTFIPCITVSLQII